MSRLISKLMGFLSSRSQVGVDKFGNRYFTRFEEIDGVMKEKRWVVFKGDQDPTSVPEKKAPTPEEMLELEARRERVKLNVEILKKEEEEKKLVGGIPKGKSIYKGKSPDLGSFIRQFPGASIEDTAGKLVGDKKKDDVDLDQRSSEPTGSGESFKPGSWQPPT